MQKVNSVNPNYQCGADIRALEEELLFPLLNVNSMLLICFGYLGMII